MKRNTLFSMSFAASLIVASQATAAPVVVILDSTGLGADLDELEPADLPAGPFAVPGIPGLNLTVTGISADDVGEDLNATATGLGINDGLSGDDTDAFDADRNEVATFQFDQDVLVHALDLTSFEMGEQFSFAGTLIGDGDLSNSSTDVINFAVPLAIGAGVDFELLALVGTIGIEAFKIEVATVPEPTSAGLLGGLGLLGWRRRRQSRSRRSTNCEH